MAVTLIESRGLRTPASSFESKRLYSRIEEILKSAGLNITMQDYEDPESFYKRVKGTPSYNDPNGFFEIDGGDSYVDIHGFSDDEFNSPCVTVQGTLDDSIVNAIKKSVNSVEGWEFDSQMVSKITESPQKEKRQFSYRGYIIRKRESDGESRYDIINPKKDEKSPVWTDCGSVAEAKMWINSDIAGQSESLKESAESGWSVKQFTFDAAIRGESADSLGLSAGGHGKFFNDLCEFLAEHGMEMAGDYIDAEDVTDIYKDNDYEFFQSE